MMRVNAVVSKPELIGALRDATIDNENFDASDWSKLDAEILRLIAEMIEGELASPTPLIVLYDTAAC